MRLLPLALLIALALPAAAAADPSCLPDDGTIYLCDPLDDGSTVADRSGGTFVDDGWQVDSFSDRLLYDLGSDVSSGHLSLWVRGISMQSVNDGTTSGNKHHLFELFDGLGFGDPIHYGTSVRMYGNEGVDPNVYGKLKFQYGSWPSAPHDCPGDVYLGGWDTSIWDAAAWFHWEVLYGGGQARLLLDGAEISTIDYGDCPTAHRYLFVPILPDGRIDSIAGLVYSHVSFSSCQGPCDDGDPCTADDTCVAGACAGTPMPDGEQCDDGDPGTTDDVCTDGLCEGTACGVACDDGDDCVVDEEISCDTGECLGVLADDATPCDDDDPLTWGDACLVGHCVGAACGYDCDDDNACTSDDVASCEDGSCVGEPVIDGTACDDGDGATAGDACRAGVCVGVPVDPVDPADGDDDCACDGGPTSSTLVLLPLPLMLGARRRRH